MARFRKNPVVVEAFQMTEERRWDNSEWPEWLHEAWSKDYDAVGAVFPAKAGDTVGFVMVRTLSGPVVVVWNDWIVRGVRGELYPCNPGIFEETYEPVDPDVRITVHPEEGSS